MNTDKLLAVWSRMRIAVITAAVVSIASFAMHTTGVPPKWDKGALVVFDDALAAGLLGRKSGRGFFTYDASKMFGG